MKLNEKLGTNKEADTFEDDGIDWHDFIVV